MGYIIENMTISTSEELTDDQNNFIESHNPGWVETDWIITCINYLISTIDDVDTRRKLENMRTDIMER